MWGIISVDISSIHIHSCDIDVSDRTTAAVYEDKLIWFIDEYLADAGYDSVRHWGGVPNPSGDIFCQFKSRRA